MMDSEDAIKNDYKDGDINYIQAVVRLEEIGYAPKDAERLVEDWDA
jgi:hypothetical protein